MNKQVYDQTLMTRIRHQLARGLELPKLLLYFTGRIWVPNRDNLRVFIRNEAHKSHYSIHPGGDKMYKDPPRHAVKT